MKSSSNFVLLALVMTIAACGSNSSKSGSSDPAVDGSGNCTQAVIDLHNTLVTKAKVYKTSKTDPSVESLKETQKTCKDLSSLLGEKTCKAQSVDTKEVLDVRAADTAPFCTVVENALTKANAPTVAQSTPAPSSPASSGTPAATTQSGAPAAGAAQAVEAIAAREIVKLKNPIQLKIKNAEQINKHLTEGTSLSIQEGASLGVAELNVQKDFCWMEKKVAATEVREGDLVKMQAAKAEANIVRIEADGLPIKLSCVKLSSMSEKWTVERVQKVLGSAIEIITSE